MNEAQKKEMQDIRAGLDAALELNRQAHDQFTACVMEYAMLTRELVEGAADWPLPEIPTLDGHATKGARP